jgi:hypothetical protein
MLKSDSEHPASMLGLTLITSTENFAYYFDETDFSQIQTVMAALESNYDRIFSDLGPVDMPVV